MVKIFKAEYINELEDEINGFGKTCTIKNVSISSYVVGYSSWHTAAVLYEK